MEYQFPNNISPPDKQFDLFISHLIHYNELNTKPGPLIDINDISLLNNEISLSINCRRTNYKSSLVNGFYLLGKVMDLGYFDFEKIKVILNISTNPPKKLSSSFPVETILDFSNQKLDIKKFIKMINLQEERN